MVPSAQLWCLSKLFQKGTVRLKVFCKVLCTVSGLLFGAWGSPFSASCAFHGFAGDSRKAPHRSAHSTHWIRRKCINGWKNQISMLSFFFFFFPNSEGYGLRAPCQRSPRSLNHTLQSGSVLLHFFPFEEFFYAFVFLHSEQNST